MLVHGTADPSVPYERSSQEFALAPAPKFFVTLVGAADIRYGPQWEAVTAQSTIDFFDRYLKDERDALGAHPDRRERGRRGEPPTGRARGVADVVRAQLPLDIPGWLASAHGNRSPLNTLP